jgi:hypothetical protein
VQVDSEVVSGNRGKSGRSVGGEGRSTVMGDSEVSGAGQREKGNHFPRVCVCFWGSYACCVTVYIYEACVH